MKNLRRLCAVALLTFALTAPAFADGQSHTGIVDPPTPPLTTAGQSHTGAAERLPSEDGQISTTEAGQIQTASSTDNPVDLVTQIAMSLLQGVLSVF
ncbi:MAG TPA: hypothetical protein VF528_03320 [Pyrinomonadaceae bacterium]|jgi:hypothetical protein